MVILFDYLPMVHEEILNEFLLLHQFLILPLTVFYNRGHPLD